MASHKQNDHNSAADQRVLQALTNYIERKEFKRDSFPHDDPVIRKKTLDQIYAAFSIIEAKQHSNTPIQRYYQKLMGDRSVYCVTPGIKIEQEDWKPLEEIRWQPLRCEHVVSGHTMLIYTPVDVFSVMSCQINMPRTTRVFYGIQSLLARENSRYFLANNPNPAASSPVWTLRSMGDHEIAKGLPIVLGTMASFTAKNRKAFEELNPLPPLQPIPAEQEEFHNFILQIIISQSRTGGVDYVPRVTSQGEDAPPVQWRAQVRQTTQVRRPRRPVTQLVTPGEIETTLFNEPPF